MKYKMFFLALAAGVCLLSGCSGNTVKQIKTQTGSAGYKKDSEQWINAAETPYGKYPELVTYTLGQMSGANNSNLPEGNTYEDNAYTRYLRKMLNIQNENVYMESEDRYDNLVNILVQDQTIPDVLVVSNR